MWLGGDMDGITEEKYTRRQWLTYQAVLRGTPFGLAIEAVSSVAIEHPEWDMDERRTWAEWEKG